MELVAVSQLLALAVHKLDCNVDGFTDKSLFGCCRYYRNSNSINISNSNG